MITDLFWNKLPFPYRPFLKTYKIQDVIAIQMARKYFGKVIISTHAFIVEDTLMDTGLSCLSPLLLEVVKKHKVKKAILSHHHEDHSGNIADLQKNGIPVYTNPLTNAIVSNGFELYLYQHIFWGKPQRALCQIFQNQEIMIGQYRAKILDAPGHSEDQKMFHIPERGWLFSADTFIYDKIKYFRRDEDFYKTKATLEKILELDFDTLFCCHRPTPKNGKQLIANKLDYFRDLELRVKQLHNQGKSVKQIAKQLVKKPTLALSFGDCSTYNLIASILHRTTPREDILKITNTI